jgi:hypothetical protein
VCACHLEPSHRLRCAVASHRRWPPVSALIGTAPVGFRGQPLGDEALEQATPLDKPPLPNACRGGHCLALPARVRSRVDRVHWHFPSCRVARFNFNAPSTSPPPAAKGQRHACVASTRGCRSSCSLRRLRPRVRALLSRPSVSRRRVFPDPLSAAADVDSPSHCLSLPLCRSWGPFIT